MKKKLCLRHHYDFFYSAAAKYLFSFFVAYCFVGPSWFLFLRPNQSSSSVFGYQRGKATLGIIINKFAAEIITSLWFLELLLVLLLTTTLVFEENISYTFIFSFITGYVSINMETSKVCLIWDFLGA